MSVKYWHRSGLTGGADGDLDAINGALLSNGDIAYVVTSTMYYVYRLDDSSGEAESSPGVIEPDENAGNKRWILIDCYCSDVHDQNTDTGTTSGTFQIDSGNSGPKLKNSSGELQSRNAADDAYADIRGKKISPEDLLDLSAAAAGQIKFPASQNASADANTLDDYEEGTWTPIITHSGGLGSGSITSYSDQQGYYRKIGSFVTVWFSIVVSDKGDLSGELSIGNLPFATGTCQASDTLRINNTVNNLPNVCTAIYNSLTRFSLFYISDTSGGITYVTQAELTNTFTIKGVISYIASA